MTHDYSNWVPDPDKITARHVREARWNALCDVSFFMGDVLERIDTFNGIMEKLFLAIESVAESIQTTSEMCHAQFEQLIMQKKEVSPSSPPFPPKKEDEESSKEEEVNNPPKSPLTPPEENLIEDMRVREDSVQKKRKYGELTAEELAQFNIFWEAYDYKRGKKRSKEYWKKLTSEERQAAIDSVGAYKGDCMLFRREMCWPSVYLNQHRWEDDYSSGLENAERRNGRHQIITREDIRRREQRQRLEEYAAVAAEFRGQGGH